jgi:hypothetical protein
MTIGFTSFSANKTHRKRGPQKQGRILDHCYLLTPQTTGKGDALRREISLFAYFFDVEKSTPPGSAGTACLAWSVRCSKIVKVAI